MLRRNERNLDNIPAGTLGIIAIDGCQAMGKEVDHFITTWRHEDGHKFMDDVVFSGYQRDSYLVNAHVPRFGSGEAKGVIDESVRGMDLYTFGRCLQLQPDIFYEWKHKSYVTR